MSREDRRGKNRRKAERLFLSSNGTMKCAEIARTLGETGSKIRKWKTLDKWNDKLQEKRKRCHADSGALHLPNSGAPRGNSNHLVHGIYSKNIGTLTEDERRLLDEVRKDEADPEKLLLHEILRMTVREYRLMKLLSEYYNGPSGEYTDNAITQGWRSTADESGRQEYDRMRFLTEDGFLSAISPSVADDPADQREEGDQKNQNDQKNQQGRSSGIRNGSEESSTSAAEGPGPGDGSAAGADGSREKQAGKKRSAHSFMEETEEVDIDAKIFRAEMELSTMQRGMVKTLEALEDVLTLMRKMSEADEEAGADFLKAFEDEDEEEKEEEEDGAEGSSGSGVQGKG